MSPSWPPLNDPIDSTSTTRVALSFTANTAARISLTPVIPLQPLWPPSAATYHLDPFHSVIQLLHSIIRSAVARERFRFLDLGFEEKKKKKKKKRPWVEIRGERSHEREGNTSGVGIYKGEASTKGDLEGRRLLISDGSDEMLGFMIKVRMGEMMMVGGGLPELGMAKELRPKLVMATTVIGRGGNGSD
ncbi:hypothetical protein LOK49_LG01G01053 [Camellia lanceoleosa]|uniref:Uncharacterized protein n=1 Tax=Camellia lanceoleosa TaxID=1840588 RepID=A0ACC0J6F4_9ERIC|nr:hypothetical protein LOK49_LG01G01053 [Camellia lanceoleosa]